MALDADKRIPDTTLPANGFKDGDILYGSDMNRVTDTLKVAINENYKDLKNASEGKGVFVINNDSTLPFIRLSSENLIEASKDGSDYTQVSGYNIVDGDGREVPRKPTLEFKDARFTDGGDRIILEGFQGKQGLTGPQGKQGVQGEQGLPGTSSTLTPTTGFFTFEVDSNGYLYAVYPTEDTTPAFEYDKETGDLYWVAEVE